MEEEVAAVAVVEAVAVVVVVVVLYVLIVCPVVAFGCRTFLTVCSHVRGLNMSYSSRRAYRAHVRTWLELAESRRFVKYLT